MKITKAQKNALEVIKRMIDCSNTNVPDYGTKILTLIFGILDLDYTYDDQITDLEGDKVLPIDPNNGNDKIQINIPNIPGVQIFPGEISHPEPCPFPPQVWYEQETEPIQPTARELRYATEVSYTGDKNGIVCTTNTADVQYNGDFRDEQTSLNDK
jgi:hypothetical protein